MSSYAAVLESRPAITMIGAGAVGGTLTRRLRAAGYPIAAILNKTLEDAQHLGAEVGAATVSTQLFELPSGTRMVFICVPDNAIAEVAQSLSHVRHDWDKTICMHTSGVLTAEELRPLADRGARVLSFHPLQTLHRGSPAGALDGVFAGIEGSPQAVASGIRLATDLGMRYVVLAAEDKPRYHLAASMASNFLVTLDSVVQQVLATIDIDRGTAQAIIEPLVRGTLDNLSRSSPEDALTGPIVRGDLATIRKHGLALRRHLPQLVPLYAALAAETVPLAVRSSRLAPHDAEAVLDMIARMVALPLPEKQPVG